MLGLWLSGFDCVCVLMCLFWVCVLVVCLFVFCVFGACVFMRVVACFRHCTFLYVCLFVCVWLCVVVCEIVFLWVSTMCVLICLFYVCVQ